jgi:hypothetical protein
MRLLQRLFFVFGFGLTLALSGCLGIDATDGALICSDNPLRQCPQGFYCLASSNHCWRYGHFPEDMAEPGQFNPGGPPDDLSVPVSDDLGTDDSGVPADLSQTD